MNLYDFCNDYLMSQTMRYFPHLKPTDLESYYDAIIFTWRPFFNSTHSSDVSKEEAMNLFAHILQNRAGLPRFINYVDNFDKIKRILKDFNTDYIEKLDGNKLFQQFKKEIGFAGSVDNSWKGYSKGIIDAAKYLNKKYSSYNNYLDYVRSNKVKAKNELSREVYFMGETLASNYFKELGMLEFGKPDTYLLPFFIANDPNVVDLNVDHGVSFEKALADQARKASVTPYKLDRIIWLIESGSYFIHSLQAPHKKTNRKTFEKALSDALKSGVVIW